MFRLGDEIRSAMEGRREPMMPFVLTRRFHRFLALAFMFSLATVAVFVGGASVNAAFADPPAVAPSCSSASQTNFSTMFLFVNSTDVPLMGVSVTANGLSAVTNSSGIAIVGGGNFTDFTVGYHGVAFRDLADGYTPLLCSGSTYYRVLIISITAAEYNGAMS